jgi:hypothetical protein
VLTIPLFDAFSNQESLIPFNRAIGMFLDFEYPFRINGINPEAQRNLVPSIIMKKCLELIFHGSTPIGNTHGSLINVGVQQ